MKCMKIRYLNSFRLLDAFNDENDDDKRVITDKEFYKQMQKLKERGSNNLPPKKSASAYILYGKEVILYL